MGSIYFLVDQVQNSCGPKIVHRVDLGKHWLSDMPM